MSLGIDLGTTFSAAAYVDDDGNVVIIRTPNNPDTMVPSAVMIHDDSVVVGDPAINACITDEAHVVRWVKRAIGDPDWQHARRLLFALPASVVPDLDGPPPDPDAPQTDEHAPAVPVTDALRLHFRTARITLDPDARTVTRVPGAQWILHSGPKAYVIREESGLINVYQGMNAIEISAEILKAIKGYAEAQLGHPVKEVVITYPAYFNDNEIRNTRRAGELAGFKVGRTVEEPVAAAVYFGVNKMKDGERTMVCDLGGGTFDATVLLRKGDVFDPLATMGDRALGGHDWTTRLVEHVAAEFLDQYGVDPRNDMIQKQALYEACEAAKRSFSQINEVSISCLLNGEPRQIAVTRDIFETATDDLVQRMVLRCETALDKIQLKWSDLDRILLVGGSSRLRRVAEALQQRSGKKPEMSPSPDLMVVYGAAIIAKGRVRGGLRPVVKSRIPRSLGIRLWDDSDPSGPLQVNALVIPQGTETPVTVSKEDFEVAIDGQKDFDIPVVEFESDTEFDRIRNYRCRCLPTARRGDRVRITFKYGSNSRELSTEAHDVQTGQKLDLDEAEFREPLMAVATPDHWVVFAIDTSYSMDGGKLAAAKQMLLDQVMQLVRPESSECLVGVVSFNSVASPVVYPTNNIDEIRRCVQTMVATGTTAMDDGLTTAKRMVEAAPPGAQRTIGLLTDGAPDADRRDSTVRVAEAIRHPGTGISLVALGIAGGDIDEAYLRRLTPDSALVQGTAQMSSAMSTLLRLRKN